jgi:predicted lipid carrier protein YhbT
VIVPVYATSLRPMALFLSDAWFDAMGAAARSADAVAPELDLVVQQVVSTEDGATVTWHMSVHGGTVAVERGRHGSPSITFTLDASTAAGIQSGAQSAQAAFMAGRLRVGGDVRLLLDQQQALLQLDDVFADVRAATTYAGAG